MQNMSKPDSPQARAERLQYLRKALRLTRIALTELCDDAFSAHTLAGWERVTHGGLSLKGAQQLVIGFKKEGIAVSVEWLLFGIGEAPALQMKKPDKSENFSLSEHEAI